MFKPFLQIQLKKKIVYSEQLYWEALVNIFMISIWCISILHLSKTKFLLNAILKLFL